MALLGSCTPAAAITSQAEFFSSDLTPAQSGLCYIHISITTGVVIDYTLDSGTTWMSLNGGTALTANVPYVFSFPISPSALFNMRKSTSGNVTPNICEVHRI